MVCAHLGNAQDRWLEDIPHDPAIDNPNFQLCNGEENVLQYFNVGNNIEIEGDRPFILETFAREYDSSVSQESGLVRIRFVINCKGEADRYRLLTSDLEYQPYEMDKRITDQLMRITKSLTGWKEKFTEDEAATSVDYYLYLVFRIVNGKIVKILP